MKVFTMHTHTQAHIANTLVHITQTGTHSHAYINRAHTYHMHTNRHTFCIVKTIVIKPRINIHTYTYA